MTRRLLLQSTIAAASLPGKGPDDFARTIFDRVNELRGLRGVPPLDWSDRVAACARQQSDRKAMLRFPGHEDPERGGVSARLDAAAIPWQRCAENVFMENGYDDAANFAIVFWWYSLGHQANMLNPDYTQTGVGVTHAADGAWFATQIFVTPSNVRHSKRN